MMFTKVWSLSLGTLLLLFNIGALHAASHDFFKGKTVRIVVGLTVGGAFDTYARTIARHFGKHIPGNPAFIVDNMPGAGSLVAANYIYNVAKPDGLTIGNFLTGLIVGQVLGQPQIAFNASRFEYVGSPDRNHPVCAFSKASGITSIEKWMASKTPIKLGSSGPGATTHDVPSILSATLGLPTQIIPGYQGPTEIQLAVSRGELGGVCNSWQSLKVTSSHDIEAGNLVVVLQAMPYAHAELGGIPLAISFAKTNDSREVIQAGIHDVSIISRPYILPPGTPKDRVNVLRKGFVATLTDPQFVAEAKKARLEPDHVTGEEVEKIAARLLKINPTALAKLKEILRQ